MILDFAQSFALRLGNSPALLGITCLGVSLLLWRLWTFTLLPIWHPLEPKEIPYWIPCHALAFRKDSHALVNYGRRLFQNDRKPFAITLAGQKIYVLSSPEDVTAAYRNSKALVFDGFIHHVLTAMGLTSGALRMVWTKPTQSDDSTTSTNPLQKPLAHLARDFYKQQLLPGNRLEALSKKLIFYIDRSLSDDVLVNKKLPLMEWCGEILIRAATDSLFGERLLQTEPELISTFLDFNADGWMLIYKYPRIAARKMYAARDRIISTLLVYIQSLSKEGRSGESWLVSSLDLALDHLGIADHDKARMMMIVFWASNANAYRICFWILTYLAFDKDLLSSIRNETRQAFTNGSLDIKYLEEGFPRLEELYLEILRVTSAAASVRTTAEPTVIGGMTLRRGVRVLMPFRQLHFNEEAFGKNTDDFHPARFTKDRNLKNHPSYRPFGGGTTHCPGRFLAKREVFAFVAFILNRFEIELTPPKLCDGKGASRQSFPKMDESTPNTGVLGTLNREEVYITLKKLVL